MTNEELLQKTNAELLEHINKLEEENKRLVELEKKERELVNWLKDKITVHKSRYISSTRYENVCNDVLEKIKEK